AARSDQSARLVPESEVGDDLPITFEISPPQVVEESTPLTDHFEQPATAVVVLRVGAEVVGEIVDSFGEKGDLDFGRAGVSLGFAVLLYCRCFLECHLDWFFAQDHFPAHVTVS